MRELNRADKQHLEAAEGWLGLGNWQEANEELENITAVMRARPEVLNARFRVYEAAGKWDAALEVASALCKLKPNEPMPCVYLARALNALGNTKEATKFLTEAAAHVRATEELCYELACCCCRLGEEAAARKWLERAFEIKRNPAIMVRALDDPRLDALWT